jgi:hypothetical protein
LLSASILVSHSVVLKPPSSFNTMAGSIVRLASAFAVSSRALRRVDHDALHADARHRTTARIPAEQPQVVHVGAQHGCCKHDRQRSVRFARYARDVLRTIAPGGRCNPRAYL